MINISVKVRSEEFFNSIRGFEEHLRGTRSVMIVIGRGLRDYTKETIRMGGRPKYPWAPLSPWTIATKGRTKPLGNMQKFIRYRADANNAEVFGADTGENWTVDQHHRGFYIPARFSARPVMHAKLPGLGRKFFVSARWANVPARPFFPDAQQMEEPSRLAVENWVAEGARRKWH